MDSKPVKNALGDAMLANPTFIEEQFERFQNNPKELDDSWRDFFTNLESTKSDFKNTFTEEKGETSCKGATIHALSEAYRTYGHLKAHLNPLETNMDQDHWQLALKRFGLKESDFHQLFPTQGMLEKNEAPLSEIIAHLENIYCGTVGIEYMGLNNPEMEQWLQSHIEPLGFKNQLTMDQKKMTLQHLNKSELLEVFLHTKYTGQKRFSLEGGETLIPMLAAIIDKGAEEGVTDFYIGMAHRGRLNVLSNILNKSYSLIFSEFDENFIPESFEQSGDVKYHTGFFSDTSSSHGHKVHIFLTPNPSHLEAVGPVIEGQAYAKQKSKVPPSKKSVVPIIIHGDAAVAGQGVVYETLQLQGLKGYGTGGSIHLVINNQIGFTTLPQDSRSTRYCTDIARSFGTPVFHVNAEDPEGCVYAAYLAIEIRQKFQCDVFIDIVCYRKYGHNEGDEPAFTQPSEYAIISKKTSIRELYRDELINQGILEKKISEALESDFKSSLQEELQFIKEAKRPSTEIPNLTYKKSGFAHINTGVPLSTLQQIAEIGCKVPEGFNIHPKLTRLLSDRLSMVQGGENSKQIDWGMAEMLAIGSLLWEGIGVRLSGQDSCRGTFSHRHAMWIDQKTETQYYPLQHLKPDQGRFELFNSALSEFAILAFEFGYSISDQNVLVIWEAQFGDFCNGAQVIIDQFISTGEQKWGQQSGLTLLLPHGYEGQGPEHSSARIERFLTLAGQDNLLIVNASTPAQLFHLLRRQQLMNEKKPLIVFTPKALLRHPACVSRIEDLVMGSFQEIIDDPRPMESVEKIIVCSGHIYYDLLAERDKVKADNVAIIRIEQFYPFHVERMKEILGKYKGLKYLTWAQEEPTNMGPGTFIESLLLGLLPPNVTFNSVARPRSASPAVGSHMIHKKQLSDLLNAVFSKEQPSIFEIASQTKARS